MRCIVPTVTGHSCSLIATKITHTPFASLLKMQRKNAIHFFPEIYPGRVSDPINTSGSTTVPTAIPTPTFLPPPQSSPPTRKPFSRCPKPPSPSSADDWQTRRKNYRPPHPHLRPHLCNSVASNVGRSFAKISSADSGRCTSFLKPGILSAFHISRDDAARPRRPAFFRDAFSPWRLTPNTDGIQPGVNGPRFRVCRQP